MTDKVSTNIPDEMLHDSKMKTNTVDSQDHCLYAKSVILLVLN